MFLVKFLASRTDLEDFSCRYDQVNEYFKTFSFLKNHSDTRHFIAGGFAGKFRMFIATPFDVVGTRFIAQDHNKGYNTIRSAFKSILRKEGLRGLYRGLIPSITAITPNTAIQFGSYSVLLQDYTKYTNEEPSRCAVLFAEMLSGILAKVIVYPLDLSKKRLQIQQFHENRTNYGRNISTTGI